MSNELWSRDDYLVITAFWSSEFLHCFIGPRMAQQAELFENEWKYPSVALNEKIVIVFKCLIALIVALFADLHNYLLELSAAGMLIYLSVPIFGLCLPHLSSIQMMLMRWGYASHFMARAVRFSAIFQQPPDRSGYHTRVTTTAYESFISLAAFAIFFVLRTEARDMSYMYTMIIWSIVTVAILAVLLLHYMAIPLMDIPEVEENTVGKVVSGISNDPRGEQYRYEPARRAHGAVAVSMFIHIILMFSCMNITDIAISNVYRTENHALRISPTNELIAATVRLFLIPVICLLFALLKGQYGKRGEGLLLALVYLFNIISLALSIIFLTTQPMENVYELHNQTDSKIYYVEPTIMEPMAASVYFDTTEGVPPVIVQVAGRKMRIDQTPVMRTNQRSFISERITRPKTVSIICLIESSQRVIKKMDLVIEPKTQYYFLVWPHRPNQFEVVNYRNSVFTFEYKRGISLLFFVSGVDLTRPFSVSIYRGVIDVADSTLLMKTLGAKDFVENRTVSVELPERTYTLLFTGGEKNVIDSRSAVTEVLTTYITCFDNRNRTYQLLEIYKTQAMSPRPMESETVPATSLVFQSLALTCASVSFINFYWAESPTRLRTTILAVAFVFDEILALLTHHIFPIVRLVEAYCFLALNLIVGSLHVVIFFIYLIWYTKEGVNMDLLDDDDEEDEDDSIQAYSSTITAGSNIQATSWPSWLRSK